MTRASISELKARLSAYLNIVRQGEEVLVTDRGRLVARLSPIRGAALEDGRRELLLRSGRLRAPSGPLAKPLGVIRFPPVANSPTNAAESS